ncbi:ribonuclease H-like domain-containing protein [Tanacetum coccineum]|uniref:Ribonuclease H-like domain-containing protein n=1 Tax=Tanacetum coccineum TaxID=301880 RepID=A0ABQ5HT24_9ASTR
MFSNVTTLVHFAENRPIQWTTDGKEYRPYYQDQGTGKKEAKSANCLLTMDDANEIYAKDEKLKRYRRIGMKAVKEKEQLQKIVDSWKNSSNNLWKLVDSDMTSNSNFGLGYEIQSNKEVLSYEEEMNRTVFQCTEKDFLNKPLYSRFSKTDNFKGGPQKPEISDSDDNSTEHSTCQSNDSEGSFGNPFEHSSESESESISVPNEMSTSKSITTNEKVMSESKEVEPSCATHVKTPRQQMKNQGTPGVKGKNWNKMMERELEEGYSFIKKKCFVYGSLSHLIKDYDFYEKKMAREVELKKQRVFTTGNGVAKPVWNNANRVNYANHFVPRPVQLNSVRQNVNSVRTNINTVRSKQPVPTNNTNSFSPVRPQVNKFNQRSHFSTSHSPVRRPIVRNTARMTYSHVVKGNWGTAVKTSACYNWRRTRPNSNYNSGSNFVRTDHPLKNMEDRGIFDSGCSGHMTGNKDHLDDFEECKGGSVTFGGSKGYITGKGRIRVGNLDFDSVSFVKELGHFNLYSISQICDKHHMVLFTETECLVVSPDFKMPDENQILLKVPRQDNMYSFDMKSPSLTKDYACLIAKATSDESKLWHRRLGHINFKNLNKLVKGNLVRGLPSKEYSYARTPSGMGWVLINDEQDLIEGCLKPCRVLHSYHLLSWQKLEKPNVKGVGYRWMFDIDYLIDSMNYIHVSLDNQSNPHAGTSEVTNSAGILQQKLDQKEDTPEILRFFRRELDDLAQKHLREVPKNKATSTNLVNSGSGIDDAQPADQDDSDMPELTSLSNLCQSIFDDAFMMRGDSAVYHVRQQLIEARPIFYNDSYEKKLFRVEKIKHTSCS